LSAHLQPEIFFNPAVYFVERCMPSNQNAHNNRAQGMSSHVKVFFQGGTQMAKKKVVKKKATKKKTAKKKK